MITGGTGSGRERAHLRPLGNVCATCGARATQALYNGFNSHMADYCGKHAQAALERFRENR